MSSFKLNFRSASFILFLFSIVIILVILFLYSKTSSIKTTLPSLPVITVTQVVSQKVATKIMLPGTVVSPVIVKIRPRVDGQILQIHFHDGDKVQKDQLLFTLDDTLLQAQLTQAEGALARDKANLDFAESEVKRNRPLLERTYTSVSKFDQAMTTAESGRGTLQSNQGLIDQYKTQISYTKIYSPIDGRIGFKDIDQGNFVHAADTNPLATVVQLDPVEFHFALPEKYIPHLQKLDPSQIEARLYNMNRQPYETVGHLKSLDNQVDPTSGTLLIAAMFDNKNFQLLPGQYMTIEFDLSVATEALILPLDAVQMGQTSSYVYIYRPEDQTVHYRAIQTEAFDDKISVITSGLTLGETVVTSGHLKIKDKMKVKVVPSTEPKAP